MSIAIHFGAGNIGRGFIGGLLSRSGYHVVFADINTTIISKLNEEKKYSIFIVDEIMEEQVIENVSGMLVEEAGLINAAGEAELITTAVGPVALPKIASCISKCIGRRKEKKIQRPLNIIACENMFGASETLKNSVLQHLDTEGKQYVEEFVGFPNSVVDRIVPPGAAEGNNILAVRVEPFYEWIVDGTGFKGNRPNILGMITTDKLLSYVERKLFTLNTGHAVTAYLGKAFGYDSIRQSIMDAKILECVNEAMAESGAALICKHGFDKDAHQEYIKKILKRFQNPYLDDSVERVGREPLRKLSKSDRLIKPVLLAEEYGIEPKNLIVGTAAAFHFRTDNDPQSMELQAMIRNTGLKAAILTVTGLDPQSHIVEKIMENYYNLEKQGWITNCKTG